MFLCFFFFKQKTAYEMRISDWSSDVCSSDLVRDRFGAQGKGIGEGGVGGDAEPIRRDRLAQRSGYAEPIERQDRPLARLDPENAARIAAVGHRDRKGVV